MNIFQSAEELVRFWSITRGEQESPLTETVRGIINEVRSRKDAALRELTQTFDGVTLRRIRVPEGEIRNAVDRLDGEFRNILRDSARNINRYHQRQLPASWKETLPGGVTLGQQYTPVESVGVYVPGGKAVYPSTLLMNCVPAQIAGVARIAVVSPPGANGSVHPDILGSAGLLGIDEIYSIGGAQAVAALAYGTETVKPVVTITGPGNKYVAEAKKQVFGTVGIDIPAGPTEMVILADESAEADYVMWDLLAQAEHDPDAKTALISTSSSLCDRVGREIDSRAGETSRSEIIRTSLSRNGALLVVESIADGIKIVNTLAPEHLEIMTLTAEKDAQEIRNCGAIFLGSYTPGAVGDYWAGPNHTLPTAGAARFASPLNVMDFMKFTSVTGYSRDAIRKAGRSVSTFAQREKLDAHAQSVEVRNE